MRFVPLTYRYKHKDLRDSLILCQIEQNNIGFPPRVYDLNQPWGFGPVNSIYTARALSCRAGFKYIQKEFDSFPCYDYGTSWDLGG